MKLIANRQLTGTYGTVAPGEEFECPDEVAGELLRAMLARPAAPPRVTYETKVIWPALPEALGVSPRLPFRDLSLSDPQPPPLAAPSCTVLPITDIHAQGNVDHRGRGRRARSGTHG